MTSILRHIPVKPIAAVLLALTFSGSGIGEALRGPPALSPEQRIQQQVATARPGSAITIPPGRYGTIRLLNVRHDPAIEVRMTGVTLGGLYIRNSAGLNFVGGTVDPQDLSRVAVDALSVENMSFRDMTATRALRGFTVGRARNIKLINNVAHQLRSDGFNVAAVQHVLVEGNRCHDFSPIKATRSADGKLIKDGDHPDCIQSWSRTHEIPNLDITVRNNRIEGDMQGIFFGDHPGDGGFDQIQIIDNIVNVGAPNGIRLGGGRNSRVTGNRVSSLPGYAFPNGQAVRTSIIIDDPDLTIACDNIVEDFPDSLPTKKCRQP